MKKSTKPRRPSTKRSSPPSKKKSKSKIKVKASHLEKPDQAALFRGILEAAPDAMIILGQNGRILIVNAQAEVVFGWKREEMLGRPIEMLVPPRFKTHHPDKRKGYSSNPKARPMGAGLDLYALRKDGTEFPAEISLSPLKTPEGVYVTAAIRDTTERKRQLEEENRRIQETNRLKSEFLANMSHELRTPLNAIIGFSELMANGKVGEMAPDQKEYMGDILISARHLLRLINDVLDLTKVEAGKMEFRPEVLDLSKVAGEVKDILRGMASQKRIRIELEMEANLSTALLDSSKFKQVLYNFLSNAIKFTPDEGLVTLRIKKEDESHFRLEVKDTGIGIKKEDLPRLFVEFQQLDTGSSKKFSGTGLGLALTKSIVEAQGGKVGVQSEPGKGSVFFAILPFEAKVGE